LQNREGQIIENAWFLGRQVLGNRNFLPRISVSGWEASSTLTNTGVPPPAVAAANVRIADNPGVIIVSGSK
jgi:hypothetical protein